MKHPPQHLPMPPRAGFAKRLFASSAALILCAMTIPSQAQTTGTTNVPKKKIIYELQPIIAAPADGSMLPISLSTSILNIDEIEGQPTRGPKDKEISWTADRGGPVFLSQSKPSSQSNASTQNDTPPNRGSAVALDFLQPFVKQSKPEDRKVKVTATYIPSQEEETSEDSTEDTDTDANSLPPTVKENPREEEVSLTYLDFWIAGSEESDDDVLIVRPTIAQSSDQGKKVIHWAKVVVKHSVPGELPLLLQSAGSQPVYFYGEQNDPNQLSEEPKLEKVLKQPYANNQYFWVGTDAKGEGTATIQAQGNLGTGYKNAPEQKTLKLVPVEIESKDRFLAGAIDTAHPIFQTAKIHLVNSSSGEDLGTFDLSGADPNTHIYASKNAMFSDEELDRAISGNLNDSSKEANQSVVFYREGTKIKFRTVFNDLGIVEIKIKKSDGTELGTLTHSLTTDPEFGDFLEFMAQRIRSIYVGELPVIPTLNNVIGDGSEDDYYYGNGDLPVLAALAVDHGGAPALATLSPPLPVNNNSVAGSQVHVPWTGRVRNFLTKCSDTVVLGDVFVVKGAVGHIKGIIDGFWDGIKSDAQGLAELSMLVTGDFRGDYHRAKELWDGLKLLKDLDAASWKAMLNDMVNSFMASSAQNLPWQFQAGNVADQVALLQYIEGYVSGFIIEQGVVMYLGAGVVSKVGQGMKVVVGLVKSSQLAANLIDKARKLIVPLIHYISQFANDAQMLRTMRNVIQEVGQQVMQNGKKVAEVIQETIDRFNNSLVNAKVIAEQLMHSAKAHASILTEYIITGTMRRSADLIIEMGIWSISQDAFMGFIRFFPHSIKAGGGDFFHYMILFCKDNGVLNKQHLDNLLAMFSHLNPTAFFTKHPTIPGAWVSPQGLIYKLDKTNTGFGHRIIHVLHHRYPIRQGPPPPIPQPHSVFSMSPTDLFKNLDQAWIQRLQPGTLSNLHRATRTRDAFIIPWQGAGTIPGEDFILIIVNKGTGEVVTAYPVTAAFTFPP